MKIEAHTFCEAFWRGKTRRFALALFEGYVHFWEPDSEEFLNAPDEWLFCVEGKVAMAHPEMLPDVLRYWFEQGVRTRRLQLSDELSLFLADVGGKSQLLFHSGEERSGSFSFGRCDRLFSSPASQWIEWMEKEALETPLGYEQLADLLHELKIPYADGLATHLVLTRGTEAEMRQIAELIFQLEPAWIQQVLNVRRNEGCVGVTVLLHLHKPPRFDSGGTTKNGGWFSLPNPRATLWQTLLDYFNPRPDTQFHRDEIEAGRRVFSTGFWPQKYWDDYDWRCDHAPELSQHEQLETRLQLRDWLRERANLSNERIAQLLN